MTAKRRIDWERMRNDLEGARLNITRRISEGSMDGLREKLALDLGTDNAERLLPKDITRLYSDYQLSLGLSRDNRAIYAHLPNVALIYGTEFPEEYYEVESSLPQRAGKLFADIRERVVQEAQIEELRKGKQFISAGHIILLPFSFDTSKYLFTDRAE